MKKIICVLITGMFLSACGEQFQGNFSGQAQVERNTCTNRYGTYELTVRARFSGNSADFRILNFSPAAGSSSSIDKTSSALYITGDYFRGLNLFANLVGETSIEGRDPFYEVTELNRDLLRAIEDGRISEEDITKTEYDLIEITGEVNSSRDVISTLRVTRFTEVLRAGKLVECEVSFFAPELILEQ